MLLRSPVGDLYHPWTNLARPSWPNTFTHTNYLFCTVPSSQAQGRHFHFSSRRKMQSTPHILSLRGMALEETTSGCNTFACSNGNFQQDNMQRWREASTSEHEVGMHKNMINNANLITIQAVYTNGQARTMQNMNELTHTKACAATQLTLERRMEMRSRRQELRHQEWAWLQLPTWRAGTTLDNLNSYLISHTLYCYAEQINGRVRSKKKWRLQELAGSCWDVVFTVHCTAYLSPH